MDNFQDEQLETCMIFFSAVFFGTLASAALILAIYYFLTSFVLPIDPFIALVIWGISAVFTHYISIIFRVSKEGDGFILIPMLILVSGIAYGSGRVVIKLNSVMHQELLPWNVFNIVEVWHWKILIFAVIAFVLNFFVSAASAAKED